MQDSTPVRIKPYPKPKKVFKRKNYRKAFPFLLEEFEGRCAYSGQHVLRAGGETAMEIDHFDPRKKKLVIQDYHNLLPATRHCNLSKGDFWPNRKQSANGLRIINPRAEPDYGLHIFEDPNSHWLWGATATGRWHIRKCDLNAPHFIHERKHRARIWKMLRLDCGVTLQITSIEVPQPLEKLVEVVREMIPEWPFREPPKDYLWV
jgi:hypothetical protein